MSLRVVSYNVLSSHLASPSHFNKCDPEHLDASNRFAKVIQKLKSEIRQDSTATTTSTKEGEEGKKKLPVVFCLQEISHDWAGKFHTFFASENYHFITGLYGKKFNGYMGIGIAFPSDKFQLLDADISRLSDKNPDGWPRPPSLEEEEQEKTLGLIRGVWNFSRNLLSTILQPARKLIRFDINKKIYPDHWELSENRQNILLFCRLLPKQLDLSATSSSSTKHVPFCISNYHMPCAFYAPMVMSIHSELAVKHCLSLAKNDPLMFAGDFNILPNSSTYELITTGSLDPNDESYPTPKYNYTWTPNIGKGMLSAYAEANNGKSQTQQTTKQVEGEEAQVAVERGEPDFTNYAQFGDNQEFIGTLDYIFLSRNHWKVNSVQETIHRDDANGPYPNQEEPSDHILISADLELNQQDQS